ncbi:MAG: hypothetical protein ACYC7E_21055 [Armatimonadota bacterium]
MKACLYALLFLFALSGAVAEEALVLRFDQPMSTMVDIHHWDETKQQWLPAKQQGDMFFDAVHRFLLLRFPGSAEAIHAKLREGYRVDEARLTFRWAKQEWERVEGYQGWRGWMFKDKTPPDWHASVWALRRPWTDDAQVGPTWNAYINGAGYWRAGGGLDKSFDHFPRLLGETLLTARHPDGAVDVTSLLASAAYGKDPMARLRALADCGFLIHKSELFNREFGNWCTGVCRIWIAGPALTVTLKKTDNPAPVADLPPAAAVPALAARLKAQGGDGVPTSRIPDNLEALAAQVWAKPADVPDWMWKRVLEVRDIKTKSPYLDNRLHVGLTSGDRALYLKTMQEMLAMPPGYFVGHSHLDYLIPLLRYDAVLPGALRYHFRKFVETRWTPPYDEQSIFDHRVGYYAYMATQNHQSQFRSEAVLAGEYLGLPDLVTHARYALSLYDRQTIYSEGMNQERGDSFYLGISLGGIQSVARLSEDPLTRLKASMDVEKILTELSATYHPGLRREVSRISRRYTIPEYILGQDVPLAAMHMLSKKGVLLHLDKPEVHGMSTVNFHAGNAPRAALLAPWGRDWEANVVDEKPLPFSSRSTYYERGLLDEPVYASSHLGRHYGIASMNSDIGSEQTAVLTWKRPRARVESLDDLVIGFLWANVNGKPLNRMDSQKPFGKPINPLTGVLQLNNKMLYVVKPNERRFLEEEAKKTGFTEISSRIHIYAYGPSEEREIRINGKPVTQFPATAKAGDVIAIHDGASYAGFIPLPATDLGRTAQVVLRYQHPLLTLDNCILSAEKPVLPTDALWQGLKEATAGWAVEMGDVDESGTFDQFCAKLAQGKLQARWAPEEHTLHVSYANGGDTLELGFLANFERPDESWWSPRPSKVLAYQRANGRSPYPDRGIDLDCPLAQLGKAARLEKGGAVLETLAGQMALLRIEPISGTYEGLNPFTDPQPFTLRTPEGMTVRSEGPIGCARVTARPRQNTLWVEYVLPPLDGDRALERLQADGRAGKIAGVYPVEQKISFYLRPDIDVRNNRRDAARALLVSGVARPPAVILNGQPLRAPIEKLSLDGKVWYRVPVAE